MKGEYEKILAEIGGSQMVEQFQARVLATPPKPLPTTEIDNFSVGYAMVIGALATTADLILDQAFRQEMATKHAQVDPKTQAELEARVKKRLEELSVNPTDKGKPGMAMDWYQKLNEDLGLKSPFRLRPRNHRILNHTDERTVIEMLMKGEAGIGKLVYKIFPAMSREAATELLKMHLDADRCSPASLPLKMMSWLWEQGIKAGDPANVGEPSAVFKLLQGMTKNVDWSKWLNKFFGEGLVPEGATIGEAMLKLYDSGALNQRVFWTSDLGAAAGGVKRRLVITAVMELGVEVFAFLEGVKKGHINWNGNAAQLGNEVKAWRDQPKYVDMKIIAQAFAASGGAARAMFTGDILQVNYFSIGMVLKHLYTYSDVERRHLQRLVEFARQDSNEIFAGFTRATGIRPRRNFTLIDGGITMATTLDTRLIKAGCQSTRVRVLATDHPSDLEGIVSRIEAASKKAAGDGDKEAAFDSICESWYLSDETDDKKAIAKLRKDLADVEKAVGG
jgi:hypothetical protein